MTGQEESPGKSLLLMEAVLDPTKTLIVRLIDTGAIEFTYQFPRLDYDRKRLLEILDGVLYHINSIDTASLFRLYMYIVSLENPCEDLQRKKRALLCSFTDAQPNECFRMLQNLLIFAQQEPDRDIFDELYQDVMDLLLRHCTHLTGDIIHKCQRLEQLFTFLISTCAEQQQSNMPLLDNSSCAQLFFSSLMLQLPPIVLRFFFTSEEDMCYFLSAKHLQDLLCTRYCASLILFDHIRSCKGQDPLKISIHLDGLVSVGPFILLADRAFYGTRTSLTQTTFWNVFTSLQSNHAGGMDSTSLVNSYVYSSLASLIRTSSTLIDTATQPTTQDFSPIDRRKALLSKFTDLALGGSPEFRDVFNRSTLCSLVYWLCVARSIRAMLPTLISDISNNRISEHRIAIGSLMCEIFQCFYPRRVGAIPFLGISKQGHQTLTELCTLVKTDWGLTVYQTGQEPSEASYINEISLVLTVQLHLYLQQAVHLHPSNTYDISPICIDLILQRTIFATALSSHTFLMLLPCWDFLLLPFGDITFIEQDNVERTYVPHAISILISYKTTHDKDASFADILTILQSLLVTALKGNFNQATLLCLQAEIAEIFRKSTLSDEEHLTKTQGIDILVFDVISGLLEIGKAAFMSNLPLSHLAVIRDTLGECIKSIYSFLHNNPTNMFPHANKLLEAYLPYSVCLLGTLINRQDNLVEGLNFADLISFIIHALAGNNLLLQSSIASSTAIHAILLNILANIIESSEHYRSYTNGAEGKRRVADFISSSVFAIIMHILDQSRVIIDWSRDEISDLLPQPAQQFYLDAHLNDLKPCSSLLIFHKTFASMAKTTLTEHNALPEDSASLWNRVTGQLDEITSFLFTIFVTVHIFPYDTSQQVILTHLNTTLKDMNLTHLSLAIIISLTKNLSETVQESSIQLYQLHVNTAAGLLLMRDKAVLSRRWPHLMESTGTSSPDNSSAKAYTSLTGFYRNIMKILITILNVVYRTHDTKLPYLLYEKELSSAYLLSHEAISPLALGEMLGTNSSLAALTERGKLVLFTFLIAAHLVAKNAIVEHMSMIVLSIPSLISFIIYSVDEFGLVLTLSVLEAILAVIVEVTTWENLIEMISEGVSHDIISFWLAINHLCELAGSTRFVDDYHLSICLVQYCLTSLGCSLYKTESFGKLIQLWASRTMLTETTPLDFLNKIVLHADFYAHNRHLTIDNAQLEHNLYTVLQDGGPELWKEASFRLTSYTFPSPTSSIVKDVKAIMEFIQVEYLPALLSELKSTRQRECSFQALSSLCTTSSNVALLTKRIEYILEALEALRDQFPVIIPKKLQRKLTRFNSLTRFASIFVYILVRESSNSIQEKDNSFLRSPIPISRLGSISFFNLVHKREEEYYTLMLASLLKLQKQVYELDITTMNNLSDTSLIAGLSDERCRTECATQKKCTLLQANMKLFTQMSLFHAQIPNIELFNNFDFPELSMDEIIDLTDNEKGNVNKSFADAQNPLSMFRSTLKEMQDKDNQPILGDEGNLVVTANDDSFAFHMDMPRTAPLESTRNRKSRSQSKASVPPVEGIQKLLAIESQLHQYLTQAQPIELLNIRAPFTGQPRTEEQNALQQFLQIHYNLVSLLITYHKQLDPAKQAAFKLSNLLSKRLTIFTSSCIKYLMIAYVNTHPCPINVTSRGLLFVVDYYVFNSVYRLNEITHIQRHYTMLFYLLSAESIQPESFLPLINKIVLIKYQFLIPLVAYWIQLYKSLPGNSASRRRLRYIPNIRSLILVDEMLAEAVLSYARGVGQIKVDSYSLATFIKMLSYSYRIEAQLPTILRMLNYSFPMQLRILEAEVSAKLKLLKPIITGEDEATVALLLLKSGRLTIDLQDALEDYNAFDSSITGGKARVQKYPLASHLRDVTMYYTPRCTMNEVKSYVFADLLEKMHDLKSHNWCYRLVKKVQCTGCCKDSNPHELIQLRYFKQVPPLAASHLLLANNYWKYRNSVNFISFCSSTEPLQEELQAVLYRGRTIYGLHIPNIFIPTVSFAFAKMGNISLINSITLRSDEYILFSPQATRNTQEQPVHPSIDFTNEYTINSLAFWYTLLKLLLSRVSNMIIDHPVETYLDPLLGTVTGDISNVSGLSMPALSAQRSLAMSKTAALSQQFTQLMGIDILEDSRNRGKDGQGKSFTTQKTEEIESFLPYNDYQSQYFEWVQLKCDKNAHVLACNSLWQLVNMAFAEKGTIYVAASRREIPYYIFNTAAIKDNRVLEIATERYMSLFRAEMPNIKLALLHIYLTQKNLQWTLSDTELAHNIIQSLRL